jgi:hypothetical protein
MNETKIINELVLLRSFDEVIFPYLITRKGKLLLLQKKVEVIVILHSENPKINEELVLLVLKK